MNRIQWSALLVVIAGCSAGAVGCGSSDSGSLNSTSSVDAGAGKAGSGTGGGSQAGGTGAGGASVGGGGSSGSGGATGGTTGAGGSGGPDASVSGGATGSGGVGGSGGAAPSCRTGETDCTGTCVNLSASASSCGACGSACKVPRATPACSAGQCVVAQCDAGFADCNAVAADGCEVNTGLDALNCGSCGSICAVAHSTAACVSGQCSIAACNAGFADCNAIATDGCEVSLRNSVANCGGCGTACSGTLVCSDGACTTACGAGETNCSRSCTNTRSDPTNCGACGVACKLPNAASSCGAGRCAVAACSAGFADCNGNATDGCEVKLGIDANNCGACGNACVVANATAACSGGQCAIAACKAGFADCNGSAADGCEARLAADGANCGACGKACPATAVCNAGACAAGCGAQQTSCAGSCTALGSDPASCGTCGNVCSVPHAAPACTSGQCAVGSCAAGFANCNGTVADGCEVNIATSVANCGTCGNACRPPNAVAACAGGACTIGSCNPGFADCNGLLLDGCEANTAADVGTCGGCGNTCTVPNATPSCVAGQCGVGSCTPGFADCDSLAANGCETGVSSDLSNCGACGGTCTLSNATPSCSGGRCTIAACAAGFFDCNGIASDGCEVFVATDPGACGGCGQVCNFANATAGCAAGQCTIASCNAGFLDCNGVASDGCEINAETDAKSCGKCGVACTGGQVCSGGSCTANCTGGTTNCGGSCVTLATDPNHCGSCTGACSLPNAIAGCAGGLCSIAGCSAGFADCNGVASDGCEVNLQTSLSSCGGCGVACNLAAAVSVCSAGACTIAFCAVGFTDCNLNASDGCEVNTSTSPANCSACGKACALANATPGCVGGACIIATCNAGTGDCNGVASDGCEVNTNTNIANCGACGAACNLPNATPNCAAGVCGIAACKLGFADCDGDPANGCEARLATSLGNCGACGNACSLPQATPICDVGTCVIESCAPGFANCDLGQANGCETNLQSDPKNCSKCGASCAGSQVCSAGVCAGGCSPPASDCGGACLDLGTDPIHCGGCATVCNLPNATAGCAAGKCTVAQCNGGFADCDGNPDNGCEVDTSNGVANCGKCGAACSLPNASPVCLGGVCEVAACTGNFDDCDGVPSNGCEADLGSNVTHCGACGRACSTAGVASLQCSAGACASTCKLGFDNCARPAAPGPDDGCEKPVSASDGSCGSCANSCAAQGSGAGLVCDGAGRPANLCGCSFNGACRTTSSSSATCNTTTGRCLCGGGFATTCRPGEVCSAAAVFETCSCNGGAACGALQVCCQTPAGCKNLANDAASCGACGRACPPGFLCASGTCGCSSGAACNAGSAGSCATGICTCGATKCAAGQRCLAGGVCG